MELRVLRGGASTVDDFPPVPGLPAGERPARPGLALAPLLVTVDPRTAARIEVAAAGCGVTTTLWSVVAVESARALEAIADALEQTTAALVDPLDEIADAADGAVLGGRRSELALYSLGLRHATPRRARPARTAVNLSVPTNLLLAWQSVASQRSTNAADWASMQLRQAERSRMSWEAASAAIGLGLAEWISLQAARICSRRNSAAHTAP